MQHEKQTYFSCFNLTPLGHVYARSLAAYFVLQAQRGLYITGGANVEIS